MKLIVGLGNPGREYTHTPHNAGFAVVDALAGDNPLRRSWRFRARWARIEISGQQTALVQPQAYMNRSGPVVAGMARRLGVTAENLVVIFDDADLPLGRLRIRRGGSGGGHRGVRSIIEHFGQKDFVRLRLGIGRPGGGDLKRHVLTPLPAAQRAMMDSLVMHAAQAVQVLIAAGLAAAMNKFNAPDNECPVGPQG